MAKSNIKDTDLGYNRIISELTLLDKSYVLVGFQEGSTTKSQSRGTRTKQGGLSMPQIAADNEFGTSRIPARPFMSTSFDQNKKEINQNIQSEYIKITEGKSTVKKSLGLLGLGMVRFIQEKIRSIYYPPNSPRTIAIKKSSKPLIDFGQMVRSVTSKVVLKK